MEEREHSCKTGLKYFSLIISNLTVFDYLYRDHCENYEWYKKIMYHCRYHGKSLCTIWFVVIHSKCWWEGNPSKESIQECMTFTKTLIKSITKFNDACNENQNDPDLSDKLEYFNEVLSSIYEKVISDRMKTLTY